MTQDSTAEVMLQAICRKLMESSQLNDLRVAIRIIREHVRGHPEWLETLTAENRVLVEGVLLAEAGRNDVIH